MPIEDGDILEQNAAETSLKVLSGESGVVALNEPRTAILHAIGGDDRGAKAIALVNEPVHFSQTEYMSASVKPMRNALGSAARSG